jgi:serine/threonine-protein kinase SRPK3
MMIGLLPQSTSEALDDWVTTHPARVYAPIQSLYKTITNAFVSEKLPLPTMEDLTQCDFKVGDFSHVQIVDHQTADDITPLVLRPPEVILGGPRDESVDIWTLGPLASALLLSFAPYH